MKPAALLSALGFKNVVYMAYEMLNNEEWDKSLQKYATTLLEEIRTLRF
jgi:hypothetical protein